MFNFFNHYHWLFQIISSIIFGVIATGAEYALYRYYLPRAEKKHQAWREAFLYSLHRPFQGYVWLLVLTLIIEILIPSSNHFARLIIPFRQILTLVFLFWFVMRFIRRWEKHSVQLLQDGQARTFQDSTSVHALAQILRILTVSIVILMIMNSAGISVSTLLAFGGIGGLAFSFAAKDTLSNFIGGLMIFWDRPFSVGDWIRSMDGNIEGTVLSIGWRLTCVLSLDRRPVYIPNAIFSNIIIENPSRMFNRRIKTIIGLRYEDGVKIPSIINALETMLRTHPEIDTSQNLYVKFNELAASSLNIILSAFTKVTEQNKFLAVQEEIYLKIIAIVMEHKADFAYPTNTIYMANDFQMIPKENNH